MLDQSTSFPTRIVRDDKAGACQGRPSINEIERYWENFASNLFCLIGIELCKFTKALTYIRHFPHMVLRIAFSQSRSFLNAHFLSLLSKACHGGSYQLGYCVAVAVNLFVVGV